MREVRFYAALVAVSAWLTIALSAPVHAQPLRYIHAMPQAAIMDLCEAAHGEPAFHCVTFLPLADGTAVCVMHVPTMLRERNLERFNEVLAELRAACALPPSTMIGAAP